MSSTVEVAACGQLLRTLAPEQCLVALSVHGAKHAWERLLWIADVASLMDQYPTLDLDRVFRWSKSRRVARIVLVSVMLAHEILRTPVPREIEEMWSNDEQARTLVTGFRDRLFSSTDGREPFARRTDLQIRDGRLDGLRHLSRLAIMPTLGDWEAVPLPERMSGFYYAVRPVRLLADAVLRGRRRT
jgi:hypothetical protein